ncbi:MAG: TAXI family TRAP transporter solute-binding subunit [Rhodocyclaceae bacterium]
MRFAKPLITVLLSAAAIGAHAQEKFVSVLTGGTSGVYYPLGVALSQIYGEALPATKISVQSTKASAENLNLLQAGRGEVAFSLGDAVADAWEGNEEAGFKNKLDKLRGLAAIYPNYVQIVASADSGIRTLEDLKGKRVSVGAARSGTELNARAILRGAGMAYGDLGKVEYLPFGESVELMKNRQLDATLQSAGLGVASIRDLANAIEIVVIPVSAEVVTAIGNEAYQVGVIPANTYKGQTEDIPTATIRNLLVTHAGVSDEAVYAMTKSMMEHLDQLGTAHAAARGIDPQGVAAGMPLPLHSGAERYYRETGLLK